METSVKESLGHETSNLGPRLEDGPRLLMSMPRLNLAPSTKSASGIDSKSICMSDELCDAIVRTWKLFEKSISGVFSVEMADVLTMISLRFEAPIRSVITTKNTLNRDGIEGACEHIQHRICIACGNACGMHKSDFGRCS